MSHHDTVVPLSVVDPDDEEGELEVRFDWTPGQAPSGMSGPPEDYDPGSGDEFVILATYYMVGEKGDTLVPCGLAPHEEDKIIAWLVDHWEPPEPDYPEDF